MVDVSEIARFTPGERTLRLVMDIAAAFERYRIALEGPAGVRLRKSLKARCEVVRKGGKKKVVRKDGPMNKQTGHLGQTGRTRPLGLAWRSRRLGAQPHLASQLQQGRTQRHG